jgi:hypothetical protein
VREPTTGRPVQVPVAPAQSKGWFSFGRKGNAVQPIANDEYYDADTVDILDVVGMYQLPSN